MSAEELDGIKNSLHRIEAALLGDPQMGTKGLAQRIDDQDVRIGRVESKLLVWGGIITGASLVLNSIKNRLLE